MGVHFQLSQIQIKLSTTLSHSNTAIYYIYLGDDVDICFHCIHILFGQIVAYMFILYFHNHNHVVFTSHNLALDDV